METFGLISGLRFIDSFFPSGGYAFSAGLEAAVHAGAVRSGDDLSRYVEDFLRGIAPRDGVAVGLAHEAAVTSTLKAALAVDRELEAMKIGRESRVASGQMGRQLIRIAGEQDPPHSLLDAFLTEVESGRSPGHFPVCLGLILGACGWNKEDAVAAFLYQTAVGFVSASLKLLPIGQREGQRLLERWTPSIAELSRDMARRTRMVAWTPVQDIYAMQHSRLVTRLFRS